MLETLEYRGKLHRAHQSERPGNAYTFYAGTRTQINKYIYVPIYIYVNVELEEV